MKTYLPLILFLGGCAFLEAMGLATPDGDPTEAAGALSGFVEGLTGIDLLKIWSAIKGGEALLTGRGRQNLYNAVDPKTGLKSTLWSLAALMVGTHTPKVAKAK